MLPIAERKGVGMAKREILLCCFTILVCSPAFGFDFNGAWATAPEACSKVFEQKGGKLSITQESDLYGGGFIVQGNEIRGKIARCHVKSRREVGNKMQISATCLTDIMPSDAKFTITIVDPNRITRKLGEMFENDYVRCTDVH